MVKMKVSYEHVYVYYLESSGQIQMANFYLPFPLFHATINSKHIFLFYRGQTRPRLSVHYGSFISGFVMA